VKFTVISRGYPRDSTALVTLIAENTGTVTSVRCKLRLMLHSVSMHCCCCCC